MGDGDQPTIGVFTKVGGLRGNGHQRLRTRRRRHSQSPVAIFGRGKWHPINPASAADMRQGCVVVPIGRRFQFAAVRLIVLPLEAHATDLARRSPVDDQRIDQGQRRATAVGQIRKT